LLKKPVSVKSTGIKKVGIVLDSASQPESEKSESSESEEDNFVIVSGQRVQLSKRFNPKSKSIADKISKSRTLAPKQKGLS